MIFIHLMLKMVANGLATLVDIFVPVSVADKGQKTEDAQKPR